MQKRMGLIISGALLLLSFMATQPVYATSGTGTLFIYSDSSCTTLLPQTTSGNAGYLLPATGTTVYIKVTGITETGITAIDLQFSGAPSDEVLSTTVTGGSTTCVAWTVGTFGSTTGFSMPCGATGTVFYGTTTTPNEFMTMSNGGADGGHFYGPGTDSSGNCTTTTTTSTTSTTTTSTTSTTTTSTTSTTSTTTSTTSTSTTTTTTNHGVPEFPFGLAALFALALPALLVLRRFRPTA